MNTPADDLMLRLSTSLSSWMRDGRGSASVEYVLGSILIVATTLAGLDLYRVLDSQSLSLGAATTMADYVSQEQSPSGAFIDDLAAFVYRNEIALPADAAFVVSAVSRAEATEAEPEPPALVRWNRTIAVGEDPANPPVTLGNSCGRVGAPSGQATLPAELALEPGERVMVVEVCVSLLSRALLSGRLLAGSVFPMLSYQYRILPVRGQTMPVAPS